MTGIVIAGSAHSHVDYIRAELQHRSDLRLVGVWDDGYAAADIAAEFGAPLIADLAAVLALGAEIVACAAVYADRADITLAALHAGSDVLIDKPLCTTLEQLEAITASASATGRHVAIMLEKRTYPQTQALFTAQAANELGTVVAMSSWAPHKLLRAVRADWFLNPAQYGGILADLLVHDVDIALSLTGASSGSVRGWLGPQLDTGFHLAGGATITFDGATPSVLSAEVDWLTPAGSDIHGDYRLRAVGTSGTAELFWGRGDMELTTQAEPRRLAALPRPGRPAEAALDALLAGGSIADSVMREGFLATRIALLAELSARTGGDALPWKADA